MLCPGRIFLITLWIYETRVGGIPYLQVMITHDFTMLVFFLINILPNNVVVSQLSSRFVAYIRLNSQQLPLIVAKLTIYRPKNPNSNKLKTMFCSKQEMHINAINLFKRFVACLSDTWNHLRFCSCRVSLAAKSLQNCRAIPLVSFVGSMLSRAHAWFTACGAKRKRGPLWFRLVSIWWYDFYPTIADAWG